MGVIHWRQPSWAPFVGTTFLILKQSHPTPGISPALDREQIPWTYLHCRHPHFSQIKSGLCPSWALICAALLSGSGRLSPVWHSLKLWNKWSGFTRLEKPEGNFFFFFGSKTLPIFVICTVFSVQMHPSIFYMMDALWGRWENQTVFVSWNKMWTIEYTDFKRGKRFCIWDIWLFRTSQKHWSSSWSILKASLNPPAADSTNTSHNTQGWKGQQSGMSVDVMLMMSQRLNLFGRTVSHKVLRSLSIWSQPNRF